MVGLGETHQEISDVMKELFDNGCQILTIGQYLAPTRTKRHVPVVRFVTPEEFEDFRIEGMRIGFKYVESGPLVRSSFIAEKGYREALGQ
jgi:lipoic acid synthetase